MCAQRAPELGVVEMDLPGDDGLVEQVQQDLAIRLHDGPVQALIAARFRLMALMAASDEMREQLKPLTEGIESAISELREIIQASSPSGRWRANGQALASRPDLYAQLIDCCNEFRAETGIPCTFEILPEHTRFDAELSDLVHRCVRELLTNVRKHADATRVRLLSGVYDEGSVFIAVDDNGVGFGTINRLRTGGEERGFGLWSIEHRIQRYGGFTEIESIDGVSVRLVLPVRLLQG